MKLINFAIAFMSLLLSNIALSQEVDLKKLLQKVEAVEYKFDVVINGNHIGKATTKLAIGVPGTITFLDENQNETYRVRLTAAFHENKSKTFPMVSHTLQESINGNWVELINSDIAYEENKEGSMILLDQNSSEISIKGKASTISIDKALVEKLTYTDCEQKSLLDSSEKSNVGTLGGSGDCCGGRCSTGQYYRCCGVISCCACDAGCCSTMR